MYNEYFGFKEAPFSIAPDPRYLYMTAQHREALAHLVYGLNSEGGCILLTGEVGTGKTTICRCLLEHVPERANVALVFNPKVSEIELLETICDELKISYPDSDNSLKTYTDRIYQFLIESNRKNEKTVLIIDEAQNLNSAVLEQLRLLTNLETNQRKLLQIIILGQPELLDILARTEMRQLAQRITARFHLQPLTKNEIKIYVNHRLAVAGQNIQLFPEKSIKLLYKLSNGVPRLINILCDRALLGAYVEGQYAVHPPVIKKAASEVFGELKNVEQQLKKKQWLYPIAALLGAAFFVFAIILYLTPLPEKSSDSAEIQRLNNLSPAPEKRAEKKRDKTNTAAASTLQLMDSPATENLVKNDIEPDSLEFVAIKSETINSENKTNIDDIEKILNDINSNKISAYQALFNAWNHNYNKTNSIAACKQAENFSLRCLYKQGNLNNLKAHNRPAVLTLMNQQNQPRYITITSIQNDFATVYSNNIEYNIKLSDLDKYWYGQYILLWHKPEFYLSAITPGDNSDAVSWLSAHFSNNSLSRSKKIYDNTLIEKVKAFQAQHGLTADGIVGPVTIIQLNTESDMNVPTLTRQS